LRAFSKQSYKNIELIVVDDCSTDGSYELVEDFSKRDSRVKLIRMEQNFGGPAKPRNIGVENSKGDYIAFLDADDIWEEEKLEVQIWTNGSKRVITFTKHQIF